MPAKPVQMGPCRRSGGMGFRAVTHWGLMLLLMFAIHPSSWSADAAPVQAIQLPKQSVPAPDFSLPALDGSVFSLHDARGHVVLLHFWATWCVSCRREMPGVDAFWHQAKKKGWVLLAVNVDRGSSERVAAFVSSLGLKLPILLDADGTVRQRYHVRMLPTTYVIGRSGRILGRFFGEREWMHADMMSALDSLVGRETP